MFKWSRLNPSDDQYRAWKDPYALWLAGRNFSIALFLLLCCTFTFAPIFLLPPPNPYLHPHFTLTPPHFFPLVSAVFYGLMTVRLWDLRGLRVDRDTTVQSIAVPQVLHSWHAFLIYVCRLCPRPALRPLTRSLERTASAAWIQVSTRVSLPSPSPSTALLSTCSRCSTLSSSILFIPWCLPPGTLQSCRTLKRHWWDPKNIVQNV